MEKNFKRTTVTAALPYANGPVHIGHLAGVYVPADIYVRYLRLKRRDVIFIGGSDEHGVPVTIRAKKEGCTPQDVVDRYHALIKRSFEEFGISFDIYSRTTSETHHKLASDFFRKLYDNNKFVELESEQFYDEQEHQFLTDRNIMGECPRCHAQCAYGDQCEKCGSTLSPDELINPVNKLTGNKLVKRPTSHWYLPLNDYQQWLEKWILEEHKEGHAQLADILVQREVIFADDVEKIFGKRPWASRSEELLEAQRKAEAEAMAEQREKELEAQGTSLEQKVKEDKESKES